MFWVMINISNVLIQSKESVHANHACTRERERERASLLYCFKSFDKHNKTFSLLLSKKEFVITR